MLAQEATIFVCLAPALRFYLGNYLSSILVAHVRLILALGPKSDSSQPGRVTAIHWFRGWYGTWPSKTQKSSLFAGIGELVEEGWSFPPPEENSSDNAAHSGKRTQKIREAIWGQVWTTGLKGISLDSQLYEQINSPTHNTHTDWHTL